VLGMIAIRKRLEERCDGNAYPAGAAIAADPKPRRADANAARSNDSGRRHNQAS